MSVKRHSRGLSARARAERVPLLRCNALTLVALGWLSGCIPSQNPAQTVSEVARDFNVATRFGRMDVAMEHTSEALQREFTEHHADWGGEIRVLDVELSRLKLEDTSSAEVFVDVSWVRMNEGMLRATRLKQRWENPGGGWKLSAEERQSGDIGLLGESVVVLRPEGPRDVHFPVKTIR
jgi:hypothetical protein